MTASGRWLRDGGLALVLLVAAASEIAMRETYHRLGTELTAGSVLLAVTAVLLPLAIWRSRRAPGSEGRVTRAVPVIALVAFLALVVGPSVASSVPQVAGAGMLAGCALAGLAALAMPASTWVRLRPVLAIGALVFVWSQPLLAMVNAADRTWPDARPGETHGAGTATLVLLFDELNAREAPVFEAVLAKRGLTVNAKAIAAIDQNTSEVIPAMFAEARFAGAKPCSTSAICAGSHVLDFAKVSASGPDVDVVGFYHPYCEIRGLRWCRRGTMSYHLMDLDRWRCALWRRTQWGGAGMSPQVCAELHGRVWESVRSQVLSDALEAPTLRHGGLLFAHVPLPHPPGWPGSASLRDDYSGNISRAAAWLDDLLARVTSAGLSPRVVIFSDHPLRQNSWCGGFVQYAASGCQPDPSLDDTQVPLIVAAPAGAPQPSLARVTSNEQAFSVVRDWPRP